MRQAGRLDDATDALDDVPIAKAEMSRHLRFLHHADTYGLSMDEASISAQRLQSVPDRMAEI